MRRLICDAKLWRVLTCLLVSAFSLQAAPIDCMGAFPCAIGGGWIAFVTPNGNDVNLRNIDVTINNTNRSYNFTLDKVVTFHNLNSVTFEFLGPALPDPQRQAFFAVTEKIQNQTPHNWGAFRFDIFDENPIAADGSEHPRKAHFHFQVFTTSDRLKPPQVPDNNGTYTGTALAPKIVGKNGDTWNASILRLHDRLDPDPLNPGQFLRMDFRLVETPIPTPEPGTLGMIAGSLFVGVLGWRRQPRSPRSDA